MQLFDSKPFEGKPHVWWTFVSLTVLNQKTKCKADPQCLTAQNRNTKREIGDSSKFFSRTHLKINPLQVISMEITMLPFPNGLRHSVAPTWHFILSLPEL